MATKITLDHRGVGELLKSAEVRAELTARGERVLARARGEAPVKSGAYRAGLHLEQDTTDRVVVRIAGSTDHDAAVEARFGILARALDAAGGA